MKKEYIKPTILGIITLPEKLMSEFASKVNGPSGTTNTGEDNSLEGTIVDAGAKGYNAWTAWEE